MTTHTMLAVESPWTFECLQCDRRVVVDEQALIQGRLHEAELVLERGDEQVGHAWSTNPSLSLAAGLNLKR